MNTKSEDRRQEMERLLAEQAASGQSKKDFCASRQIKPATFYYWQRRIKEEQEPTGGFQQLRPSSGMATVKLTLPGGTGVGIEGDDFEALAALIYAIDQQYA